MKLREFLKKLLIATQNEEISWITDGAIRGWKNDDPGEDGLDWYNKPFCPLTAVKYAEHGVLLCTSGMGEAAQGLGISESLAEAIAQAADGPGRRSGLRTLRAKLIEAIC